MKLTYLGTAAAEAVPGMFCECSFCENARKRGGKEIRRRSGAIINNDLLIDFSADTNVGMFAAGKRLSDVRHLIFTHSHGDHFCRQELEFRRSPAFCILPEDREPLHIYGNETVCGKLKEYFGSEALPMYGLDINFVPPYVPFAAGEYTITPLSVVHCPPEDAYIYLFEKDGERILYANDTGVFPEATFEYLKGKKLDIVSLDCTMGFRANETGHMGFPANLKVKNILTENGCVKPGTVFISHHFSHNGLRAPEADWTYEYFSEMAAPHGFIMSYDGLTVGK